MQCHLQECVRTLSNWWAMSFVAHMPSVWYMSTAKLTSSVLIQEKGWYLGSRLRMDCGGCLLSPWQGLIKERVPDILIYSIADAIKLFQIGGYGRVSANLYNTSGDQTSLLANEISVKAWLLLIELISTAMKSIVVMDRHFVTTLFTTIWLCCHFSR